MTTTFVAAIPSPPQGVWEIGPVPIRAYAVFIIVGIIAALVLGDRRWEARGGERGVIYDIALWAVPFGLIGGRLYHVMTDWWRYFGEGGAGLAGVIRIWDGGLGIWGAVALGGVGAWIACRRRGIPLPAFGDAIAPGIVLAQAIGRIGNYFNQELYGAPTNLPWALEIYERRDASGAISNLNGVSTGEVIATVHPTFLYELLWNLVVFAVLIYVDRRFKFGHGRLFAFYVAGYCLGRFWIELLRADDATLIDGVRVNSFTATFVFIGAVVYIMSAPKGREDPATLRGDTEAGDAQRSTVEELTETLATVVAPSGVVAAAKVASDEEEHEWKADTNSEAVAEAENLTADVAEAADEDIAEAADFAESGDRAEAEDASAEALGADVAGVPADSVAEAEEFAAEGDDEPAAEAVAEAEALAEEVTEAPDEDIHEAEEFVAAGAAADGAESPEPDEAVAEEESDEAVGGVGAVEGADAEEAEADAVEADATGDDELADVLAEAAEALADAPEAHAEAVEGETEAAEVAAESEDAEAQPEAAEPSTDIEQAGEAAAGVSNDDPDVATASQDSEAPVGGVGAVEGEEAAESLAGATAAHETAIEKGRDASETATTVQPTNESRGRLRRLFRRRR